MQSICTKIFFKKMAQKIGAKMGPNQSGQIGETSSTTLIFNAIELNQNVSSAIFCQKMVFIDDCAGEIQSVGVYLKLHFRLFISGFETPCRFSCLYIGPLTFTMILTLIYLLFELNALQIYVLLALKIAKRIDVVKLAKHA